MENKQYGVLHEIGDYSQPQKLNEEENKQVNEQVNNQQNKENRK